jgi:hypothetical protein
MGIIARFAGLIDAAAYAYGISPDAPAPLQVLSGSTTSGTYTLTCQSSNTPGPNGVKIVPSTTTPITVGFGTNAETVTPSGVSLDNLGNTLITATFANAHSTGDQVRSGTVGLQEALNYASSIGGGQVITSPGWYTLGGTAAIVDAVTVPAGINFPTNADQLGIEQVATIAIPNASVLTLSSVGYALIPAPGAGNLIVVSQMVVEQVAKTAAFAGSPGNMTAAYGTQASQTAATGNIAGTILTGGAGTTNQIGMALGIAPANGNSSVLLNKAVGLYVATNDPTTGGGSLIVKIAYKVLSGF